MATGHFRGEGGVIWEMNLPLSELMQTKLTRGQLQRVNADGSSWHDEPPPVEAPVLPELKRPAQNAPKDEWVGYAVAMGMTVDDADAMTKQDLVDKYKG